MVFHEQMMGLLMFYGAIKQGKYNIRVGSIIEMHYCAYLSINESDIPREHEITHYTNIIYG